MDIADEITLMDYFPACTDSPGSVARGSNNGAGNCDPT